MNKIKFIAGAFFISSLLFLSCSKDNLSNVWSYVTKGTWRVTLYQENGVSKLYYFSNYDFTFSNSTVTATRNATTVTGTFSTKYDDSKNKLVLNFGNTSPFNELNDDWEILEESATKIRMQDVSGGSGGTDLLTFEKN
ncbi:MAG: hypothetical protein RL624_1687 [Bacteroidota bacterium]|jgi:hypothetical protein